MQLQSGPEIVEKLLACMRDNKNAKYHNFFVTLSLYLIRCQMHACSAVINFFSDMGDEYKEEFKSISSKFQETLFSQLLALFNNAERTNFH